MSGYRKLAVSAVSNTPNPTRVKRELDEALGISTFGLNYFVADPGEQVPWGRHRHPDHEEAFYVLEGRLRVETPDGEFSVGPDEAFYVPANHWNRAVAAGDEPCRLLAMGAPKEGDEAIIEEPCPECGESTGREYETKDDGETYVLSCADCGAETMRFGD
ncbi:Cupin 2 conserved barrel domain protein [halophilic archaeon DL31]|jgi:quercetin dioxygenase-like cupin family protein|nr:Cupin 2 conserved barrel domain protein [halophilic archaeon DL31]